MTDVLKDFDALPRKEQDAWSAWFNGGHRNLIRFSDRPDRVNFGKAECEWVDFDAFWLGKIVDLGWMKITITEEGEAKGAAPGTTYIKYLLEPTDLGWDVREADLARFQKRINASV